MQLRITAINLIISGLIFTVGIHDLNKWINSINKNTVYHAAMWHIKSLKDTVHVLYQGTLS
jgi:hypothetical protein